MPCSITGTALPFTFTAVGQAPGPPGNGTHDSLKTVTTMSNCPPAGVTCNPSRDGQKHRCLFAYENGLGHTCCASSQVAQASQGFSASGISLRASGAGGAATAELREVKTM